MARARQGISVKKGLKFFTFGAYGTRKSSFCLGALRLKTDSGKPLRVAYIDTEGGSIDNFLSDLEDEGIDLKNLFIVYTSSYSEAEDYINRIVNNEPLYEIDDDGNETDTQILDADGNPFIADAIVLDSSTVIMDTQKYAKIKTSEKRAKLRVSKNENATQLEKFVAESTAGMEFKDFDKLNQEGKNLLQGLVTKTDKYVFVTAREKDETEQQKTNDGFKTVKTGGKLPNTFKDAEYEFFTVLHFYEDEYDNKFKARVVRKDRTGRFAQNEVIEEPDVTMWQEIIDHNKGKADTTKKEGYNSAIEKDFKKENKDYVKLIEDDEASINAEPFDLESEEVKLKIQELSDIRSKMSQPQRTKLTRAFTDSKLPSKPTDIKNMEQLEKMIEVAKGI
jgi:hypothetical protein